MTDQQQIEELRFCLTHPNADGNIVLRVEQVVRAANTIERLIEPQMKAMKKVAISIVRGA